MKLDSSYILVVGAGFAGSVAARELADNGWKVVVVERRDHIGGNAFDEIDAHGLLVHRYGPHLFHTNSKRIFDWLSRFTDWRPYEHRVLAQVDGKLYPIPINQTTINKLYHLNLDEKGIEDYLNSVREHKEEILTSEDVVLSSVGNDLCEKFFRGYTKKQWGLDLSELAAGVAARIPTRVNNDDRYFTDKFQAMPKSGYTKMFSSILDHPNIEVLLNTDYNFFDCEFDPVHTIYSGPIDAFFKFKLGRLPYRSLTFEHRHIAGLENYQPVGTVNFPNDHSYTRITEFKHATGQRHSGTSIVYEYPKAVGEPYYPIPHKDNEELYQQYKKLARETIDVSFVGRLAQYRYYNMDQVVGAALKAAREVLDKVLANSLI